MSERDKAFAACFPGVFPRKFSGTPLPASSVLLGQNDLDTAYGLARLGSFFCARPSNVLFSPRSPGCGSPSLRLESVYVGDAGAHAAHALSPSQRLLAPPITSQV